MISGALHALLHSCLVIIYATLSNRKSADQAGSLRATSQPEREPLPSESLSSDIEIVSEDVSDSIVVDIEVPVEDIETEDEIITEVQQPGP